MRLQSEAHVVSLPGVRRQSGRQKSLQLTVRLRFSADVVPAAATDRTIHSAAVVGGVQRVQARVHARLEG